MDLAAAAIDLKIRCPAKHAMVGGPDQYFFIVIGPNDGIFHATGK
jgi:hypothetical protein